ncbi:MAG: GNAT family N-acetyltransferase [Anaerolineae bacterium]|nr:GNAT family N-acetyltransferase [Anaerolineae bacterium]
MTLPIFPCSPADRSHIYDVLMRSGVFGKSDADTVDEMFMQAMAQPGPDAYHFIGCWHDNDMLGFACYGREAMTKHTWDLFWVCVSPEARGKGVGGALLQFAVAQARANDGRLMVIYTSSTDAYAPARKLYQSQGFTPVARVADYYDTQDDLLIYTLRLVSGT